MPIATIGTRKINYIRRGSGQPLLLIQGMAGHHQLWGEPLLAGLDDQFDIVAYDHRGIGESSDEPGPFTIGDLTEDAAALMDAVGWQRPRPGHLFWWERNDETVTVVREHLLAAAT